MWVYRKNGPFFELGYYEPNGTFILESQHKSYKTASYRVRFLNGGAVPPTTPYSITQVGDTIFTLTFTSTAM